MKTDFKKKLIIIIFIIAIFVLAIGVKIKGFRYFMPPIPYIQKYVTTDSFFKHCDSYKKDIEDIATKYGYKIIMYDKNNVSENKDKGIDGSDNNFVWLLLSYESSETDVIDIMFDWTSTEEDISYAFKYKDTNGNLLNLMKEILDKTFGYKFAENELSDFISSDEEDKYLNWRKDYYISKNSSEIYIKGKTIEGKLF